MARMPRNQLLDLIFQLFRDPTRWAIKDLRVKTQQPTAFLKETLSEVAYLHKSGEHTGLYELKDIYKDEGVSTRSEIHLKKLSARDRSKRRIYRPRLSR